MTELSRRALFAGAAATGVVFAGSKGLVSPVRAAAPVTGKQNAGWYRYKVGDFEVTVVTDGANTNPLSPTYVSNASKDDVNRELEAQFMEKDKAFQTYTAVVINTGSKLVAIDTGLGVGAYAQSKGSLGQYHSNLQASGIDAGAVDVVVISHFHGDHINGLVGAGNTLAFPNAEVMVPETEWAFWTDESNVSKVPEIARGQFANVKRVLGVVGSKVTKYQSGKELVPGITSVSSPGHTPGHHSHIVASGNGKVLVQADITAGMPSLFIRNPNWHHAFDSDKEDAVASRKKLYDMAIAEKMMVQGFHFPFPSRGYVEKRGDGYQLVPALWNPSI